MQSTWVQTLIERMIYGRDATETGIRSFARRRATEQAEMAETSDPERAEQLRLTLFDIDDEIKRLEASRAQYQQRLEQFQALTTREVDGAAKLDRTALDDVKRELRRLREVYRQLGVEFELSEGVPAERLGFAERLTEIELDPHLRAMWRMTDGSGQRRWFAVGDEGDYETFDASEFLSIEQAVMDRWTVLAEYTDDEDDEDEDDDERNEAIQPHYLRHHLWFPFADADNGITTLFFDADPTAAGKLGQIVQYVHDPDTIYLAADSFIEFFRRSNNILEGALKADADALRERLL